VANRTRSSAAGKVAAKLLKDAGILQAPVMIRDVAKFLQPKYNLSVLPCSIENVDGFQVNDGEMNLIGYNREKHPNRIRFTVAHEIGHLVLGHTRQGRKKDIDLESKDPDEVAANAFAAELLMPSSWVSKDLDAGMDVEKLAKKYIVSVDAMGWAVLGLL
jgi:Zn-dependent peptidase ImmA (M78 family)